MIRSREARLTAVLIKTPANGGLRLSIEIRNEGLAGAKEIRVGLDGQLISSHPLAHHNLREVTELGPGCSFLCPLVTTPYRVSEPHKLQVTWSEDSGQSSMFLTTFTT